MRAFETTVGLSRELADEAATKLSSAIEAVGRRDPSPSRTG